MSRVVFNVVNQFKGHLLIYHRFKLGWYACLFHNLLLPLKESFTYYTRSLIDSLFFVALPTHDRTALLASCQQDFMTLLALNVKCFQKRYGTFPIAFAVAF